MERRLVQQCAVAHFGSVALNAVHLQNVLHEAVRIAAEVLQVPLTKILEFSESAEHLVVRAGTRWAEGIVGQGEVGIDLASVGVNWCLAPHAGETRLFRIVWNDPMLIGTWSASPRSEKAARRH